MDEIQRGLARLRELEVEDARRVKGQSHPSTPPKLET